MSIIIENNLLRLEISDDCIAKSLICKKTGEECLKQGTNIPLFSLTEPRPYNNEIKLAYPNKRTTFNANRVRREGDDLIVGFELVTFEARVRVDIKDTYIDFTLVDFILKYEDFAYLAMSPPPVDEFRLIQLPIKNKANFGQWLNVMWDEKCAINVLANSPYARIDSEKRDGYRILTADAVKGIKLKGCSASLIVSKTDNFLDTVDKLEEDFDLPRGVKSRRDPRIKQSTYWTCNIDTKNVDENIECAKAAGCSMILIYYICPFKEEGSYNFCGEYQWSDRYPNGMEDLKEVLGKIKAAGLTPGIHFLHSHIGTKSRYVTPVVDHRLHLTRNFTLARPLSETDTTIYVEENPEGSVTHEKCRVLRFDGEAIYYEGYTTEYPYMFTGCKRGHFDTNITCHNMGTMGGILDISEFGAGSIYINQESSLQDEIADKLEKIYNDAGFEFVYFDGSEGTNPPFEFHIPNAQYRIYKRFKNKPIYCEGAAKAHFSWHMISGGNAFDVFPMNVFKEKLAKHPLVEAPEMKKDFTRVCFGWWAYNDETMPDIYEYGTSKATASDCPAAIWSSLDKFKTNPRTADNFEVLRRWEDVRVNNWLTDEQKKMVADPNKEFILLVNEDGEYELTEYEKINLSNETEEQITAYSFERMGKSYVVLWHKTGEGKLSVALNCDFTYLQDLGKEQIATEKKGENIILSIAGRRYLETNISKADLVKAFEGATIEK